MEACTCIILYYTAMMMKLINLIIIYIATLRVQYMYKYGSMYMYNIVLHCYDDEANKSTLYNKLIIMAHVPKINMQTCIIITIIHNNNNIIAMMIIIAKINLIILII